MIQVFASALDGTPDGPLHGGRWLLRTGRLPVYAWHGDLVTSWPGCYLDWNLGWNGVVPLRPLAASDAGRVKAYRKHVRDGTLAPVLLYWLSALDGYLLIDGHDRAAAALAEGGDPPCLLLGRGVDSADQRATLDLVTGHHAELAGSLARRAEGGDVGAERRLATVVREFAALTASLPFDQARTLARPLPGGRAAWDAIAAAEGATF